MTEPFDPYRDWLGLDADLLASDTPLNFYQLIGLKPFESDIESIVRAVDRARAMVRSQRPGSHAAQWAALLDELKQVQETLSDPSRKQAYDDQLSGKHATSNGLSDPSHAAEPAAPEEMPAEIVAGEASSSMEAANSSAGHSWPPGMAPPGVSATPASATNSISETRPEPSPPDTAPETIAAQPLPSHGAANDAIPLSARWPIPESPVALPNVAPTPQSATPGSPAPTATPVAQPTGAIPQNQTPQQSPVPMAVPLAAIQSHTPHSPVVGGNTQLAPMATPVGGQPAAASNHVSPTPASESPAHGMPMGTAAVGSAAPQTPYGESPTSDNHTLPDPMAPVEIAPQSAIPMGTAVPTGSTTQQAAEHADRPAWDMGHDGNNSPGEAPRKSSESQRGKPKRSNATIYLSAAVAVVMVVGAIVVIGGFGQGDAYQQNVAQNNPSPGGDANLEPLRPLNPNDSLPRPEPVETEPLVSPPPPENEAIAPNPDMERNPVEPEPVPVQPVPPRPTPPEPEPMPKPPVVEPVTPEPMTPEPMPTEPAPPTMVAVTEAEISQLSKLLTTTRQALADQNVAEAKTTVEKAVAMAKAPAHVAKAERLRMLTMLVSEFWRAVDESIAGLDGGDVITIANTQVAVVEVTPELLIIRVSGTNRRYPRDDMSEGLAMGLADNWLDKNSEVTPLVRGAFYAVAKNGDTARAAEQWQLAASKGADVGDLPEVINDKYDEATLREEASEAMNMVAKPVVPANGSELSASDKQALANALRTARSAMTAGQLDDADAQLAIARTIAAESNLLPVVKRTETLARHARVFWNAVADGMTSLSPDSKLTIGNTEITITEVSRDRIAYTVAGLDRSHTRSELPGGLAMVIANTMLEDNTPESALARGAYYAIAEKGNADDARAAWNEAADSPDVAELLQTLDDTYQW